MNIKTKYNKIQLVAVLAVLISACSLFINTSVISAQNPDQKVRDPVLALCESKAKKVTTCAQATKEVRNKATYGCKKAKVKASCVKDKAMVYMKAAVKGNPDNAKFNRQLDDRIKNVSGDRNKPAEGFGALDPQTTTPTTSFFGTGAVDARDADGNVKEGHTCGGSETEQVITRFNFGCQGNEGADDTGPILDLLFSFIRFLSAGVGIVVVASIILAGIQYSASEGKPDATAAAKSRIQNALIGLIIYIFASSAVQFLIPGGLFV